MGFEPMTLSDHGRSWIQIPSGAWIFFPKFFVLFICFFFVVFFFFVSSCGTYSGEALTKTH